MDKKIIISIGIIAAIIIVGGLYYIVQPAAAPTQPSQNVVESLPTTNNSDQKMLHIVSGESKATYELGEVLKGKQTHVVGSTGDIAGDIAISLKDVQKIQIGEIKINARTFKTDIDMRDQNVRKMVLKSDDPANEFIVFKTTNITGVPATIESNKEFPVTITGDVTIAGVTKSITFTGIAKLSDANELRINANTMVTYGDFGVTVPNFSFLANVDKTVKLSIALIAR